MCNKRRTVEPARGNVGKKREMIIRDCVVKRCHMKFIVMLVVPALYICLSELEDLDREMTGRDKGGISEELTSVVYELNLCQRARRQGKE